MQIELTFQDGIPERWNMYRKQWKKFIRDQRVLEQQQSNLYPNTLNSIDDCEE